MDELTDLLDQFNAAAADIRTIIADNEASKSVVLASVGLPLYLAIISNIYYENPED